MTLRLALTPGEPSGIGPDLLISLVQNGYDHELVAYADPQLLQQRAAELGLSLELREPGATATTTARRAGHSSSIAAQTRRAGQLNSANGAYVLHCLDAAIADCQSNFCQAMVTGPVQKSIINDAGFAFTGHTEYLAEKTATPLVVMMLATTELRVALATTHLPLRDVADSITQASLTRVINILIADLQTKFSIPSPTILVCGLNPHAGEGGHLGREEIETISPVLSRVSRSGRQSYRPPAR